MNNLFTIPDLAKRLNVSQRTVWRLRDEGFLPPPLRLRGAVRYHEGVIEEWLRAGAPDCRRTGWAPTGEKGKRS